MNNSTLVQMSFCNHTIISTFWPVRKVVTKYKKSKLKEKHKYQPVQSIKLWEKWSKNSYKKGKREAQKQRRRFSNYCKINRALYLNTFTLSKKYNQTSKRILSLDSCGCSSMRSWFNHNLHSTWSMVSIF